ncbi:MAG: hypothetical protein PVS2B2_28090 [Candidatus Acidiferrum sp.]
MSVARIPPLRGRRSRTRAVEKAGRSGRDDRLTVAGAKGARYIVKGGSAAPMALTDLFTTFPIPDGLG